LKICAIIFDNLPTQDADSHAFLEWHHTSWKFSLNLACTLFESDDQRDFQGLHSDRSSCQSRNRTSSSHSHIKLGTGRWNRRSEMSRYYPNSFSVSC
jgi:hypothetical protein